MWCRARAAAYARPGFRTPHRGAADPTAPRGRATSCSRTIYRDRAASSDVSCSARRLRGTGPLHSTGSATGGALADDSLCMLTHMRFYAYCQEGQVSQEAEGWRMALGDAILACLTERPMTGYEL